MAKSKELTSASNFTLRLIGKGELAIPASLRGRVIKDTDLAYEVCVMSEFGDCYTCRHCLLATPLPPSGL